MKGQIVSGEFGNIVLRQKSDNPLEIGELLVANSGDSKIILQVYDLHFGSQISQQNLELISGLNLEDGSGLDFLDEKLRNYILASAKPVVSITGKSAKRVKILPDFFSNLRGVGAEDFRFLSRPENSIFVGKLRSGSKLLDVDLFLPGDKVFAHHILIAATTGRGKSNLTSCILWDSVDKDYCGTLVLDPHDEYYGRNRKGLKDHPKKEKVIYYTPRDPPPGARKLKIHIEKIRPSHLNGVISFSDPQQQALSMYYRTYGKKWVEAALLEKELPGSFMESTIAVVKRVLMSLLEISYKEGAFLSSSVFDFNAGENTINDISLDLTSSNTVIIDTSSFSGSMELLIGSMITTEIFSAYKRFKTLGQLDTKPVISVVLEEAPRVLGKEVLEKGSNIFATLAREGRKFKVGLTAITQLPSLIPRQILANMNTKIILGLEMAPERQAIIESASQDLSTDSRSIASLDVGEAIISSNFAKFALPVMIPLFSDLVKETAPTTLKSPFR